MDKLPHEKLREWAEDSKKGNFYPSSLMAKEFDFPIASEVGERDAFCKLADEIEREYITRSEHEAEIKRIVEAQGNGHPHMPSAHHIMKIYAEKIGKPMEDGESITKWLDRWFIKRKLYDDGKPAKIGDAAVAGEHGDGVIKNIGEDAKGSFASVFYTDCCGFTTHEPLKRPAPKVLDGDGVEIKVGDTVWLHGSFVPHVVSSVDGKWVKSYDGHQFLYSEELTHREPDSLEKLRDDMLAVDEPVGTITAGKWADRLTALIERGA